MIVNPEFTRINCGLLKKDKSMSSSLFDYTAPLILTITSVLTSEECSYWIDRIKDEGTQPAPINTFRGQVVSAQVRGNRRVMFDDPGWAEILFDRVRTEAPLRIHGMQLSGVNERLRCYEYRVGQHFAPHRDGVFVRDDNEYSCYTYMVYLNEGFAGGETLFFVEPEKIIVPKTGMGLLFQHPIIHAGCEVKTGTKYAIRTDLMYRREKPD
ncbi:MAG: 2OG-Fe(II) oxygenase [Acidobacteria bacterium]|nr:2OG-Fe(II) oxygenase [Acidobacteriota bacterium]